MSRYEVEAMRALGTSFSTYADELDQQTNWALSGLEMPSAAFPLFALSAVDDYERSLSAVGAVTATLRETFEAIGAALQRVAGHYDQLEADQADGFRRPHN
ncbi:hypothetical protein ABZ388_22105 [Micromonospora parva]|uniref:hypothetical protein n=1 Tax=Micromonospora parva TaxID=1464048 RepID=UPI0012DFACF5|nr:hypothetical protein [Micromonospora parva]